MSILRPLQPQGGFHQLQGRSLWKQLLLGYLPQEEPVIAQPQVNGLVLQGPAGSGKHALLLALAWELEQQGWKSYCLDAAYPEQTTAEALQELPEEPCFLLLREPEKLADAAALEQRMAQARSAGQWLLVAAALGQEERLPAALKRDFLSLQVSLPDTSERFAFLDARMGALAPELFQEMVRLMNNWNYHQLASFAHHYRCALARQIAVTGDPNQKISGKMAQWLMTLCQQPASVVPAEKKTGTKDCAQEEKPARRSWLDKE